MCASERWAILGVEQEKVRTQQEKEDEFEFESRSSVCGGDERF